MMLANLSDVSRETSERLEIYESLIHKWNPRINLVSKRSLTELRTRHFQDSLQIFTDIKKAAISWVDLGSGGGFPGLVIAILAAEHAPSLKVTLVESDMRKSAFLRTVIREANIQATVITDRIEEIPSFGADVISARALADLTTLLGYVDRHMSAKGKAILMKGKSWEDEIIKARDKWNFDYTYSKSITDDQAVILRITGVSRV